MKMWLRRLRGAIGNGVVWGLAWIGVRLVTLGIGVLAGAIPTAEAIRLILPFVAQAGALGFMSGVTFSVLFGALNHRRALWEVGMGSTALLGGTVGLASVGVLSYLLLAPAPTITLVINLGIGFTLGTSVATGSLSAARAGSRTLPSGFDGPVLSPSDDTVLVEE